MRVLKFEVGKRHGNSQMRCICRLVVDGERRGKLSLTKSEALKFASAMAEGCKTKEDLTFEVDVSTLGE